MGHCPWTLFTQRWVQCAQLLFSNACDVLRMYSCPACVGGWPFWWQLGLWVRGWESSMSTLWTDHFTPRIFVLLAFPSHLILAASPPSTLGGSILHLFLKYLDSQFLFHSTHECFDYWRVLLIYNSVTWVCVWGGGMGIQCLEGIILSGLDMRLISQKEVQTKY